MTIMNGNYLDLPSSLKWDSEIFVFCQPRKKPSSFVRNLMLGTKYLEHCGKMVIENASTKARCVLDFKQGGYFAASNVVSGTIFSPSGEILSRLEGKWDDQIALT